VSDWLAASGLLAAAAAYAWGVYRLAKRGDRWSLPRALAAVGGLALLAVALLPPLATHDDDLRVHVAQHLLLMTGGPLLLALAAPVTLALRAIGTSSRRRLLALLHSGPARAVVHPVTVLALNVGGLYAVYLTPVLEASEERPWLHALVHAHMVVGGTLLAFVVAGADPLPGRPGVAVRLGLVVGAGAAHDVLARLLFARGWGPAAQLLAAGGDVADVLLATAVLAAWYTAGGRELARTARRTTTVNAS
jgi:putative membrane protein